MRDKILLKQLQALPLTAKVTMAEQRIMEWYKHWNGDVFVSFSGGKDSTVLADLVHGIYPDVPLVFSNTGLEYPEIQSFARKNGAEFIYPRMKFSEIISTYGYPLIGKEIAEAIQFARRINDEKTRLRKRAELLGERMMDGKKDQFNKEKWLPLATETQFPISQYCCEVMKKAPMGKYKRRTKRMPITGAMASESRMREQSWIRHGCNAFTEGHQHSQPLSLWTEQDVLLYVVKNKLEICSVYGEINQSEDGCLHCSGCQRTGCVFCGFGCHLEKGETRFQRLAKTHPKQYDYCMRGGAVGGQSKVRSVRSCYGRKLEELESEKDMGSV